MPLKQLTARHPHKYSLDKMLTSRFQCLTIFPSHVFSFDTWNTWNVTAGITHQGSTVSTELRTKQTNDLTNEPRLLLRKSMEINSILFISSISNNSALKQYLKYDLKWIHRKIFTKHDETGIEWRSESIKWRSMYTDGDAQSGTYDFEGRNAYANVWW